MARLEDIQPGARVRGLSGNEAANVIAVRPIGDALKVTYEDSAGNLGQRILYRKEVDTLEIEADRSPWTFDAPTEDLRLASEAWRISLAHLFDPYLAVHTAEVEPLPHQISAVYQEMLPRLPLRYVLADDPGAGKTIMTGLYIRELVARGDLKRCLIVSPGSLCEQWQDELFQKFGMRFQILTRDRIENSATGNAFTENDLCIARLDMLSRDEALQARLRDSSWDLIVVDEAHKMSATLSGANARYTRRYRLGQLLSRITQNFLLLTATPHNGKEGDFRLFMSLLDPDQFEGAKRGGSDTSGLIRRMVKEDLLKFDGTPLFPERRASTISYSLTPQERDLYDDVARYVREEFNRADRLDAKRKNTVGFGLTILQRRLASSPEAIYQSLRRRRERLEKRLEELKSGATAPGDKNYEDYDEDDYAAGELENIQDAASLVSAATTAAELAAEIGTLKKLEEKARGLRNAIRDGEKDRKWDELEKLLTAPCMSGADGHKEKLIIFTEHRDTLNYLADRIGTLTGDPGSVVVIHGSMSRDSRRAAQERFSQDRDACVLLATDAAGEGINLQCAHFMINYDLPWNPNRIEQRFGRIHRIGQTEVCQLWNLVSQETREGAVFKRLFEKLEQQRAALGEKVFDVLGKLSFGEKPLRDLLIEAIRYGDDPEVRARLTHTVDNTLEREHLLKLIEEHALAGSVMGAAGVAGIRDDMERREAQRLQPYFVRSFFLEAFKRLGGSAEACESGRSEIRYVPAVIRNYSTVPAILKRYERICFDKQAVAVPGKPRAKLIASGHPLLEAVIALTLKKYGGAAARGAVFIDDQDGGTGARLLAAIEAAVQDGGTDGTKRREIARQIHFVELTGDGTAKDAGAAPYLDYRAPTEEERAAVLGWAATQPWLSSGLEERAAGYAVTNILPAFFEQVKNRRLSLLNKTELAVMKRLQGEIHYWDSRANELAEQEKAGKTGMKLSSGNARAKADELEARLTRRLNEIRREKDISSAPPRVAGCSLVIPAGLLGAIQGAPRDPEPDAEKRRAVEAAAMAAVMEYERSLGFVPRDVSAEKLGYDIESASPAGLRFIEVKGRSPGTKTVTVTKNEILTARNCPRQYILALAEVDGGSASVSYLKEPFHKDPEFSAHSVTYDLTALAAGALPAGGFRR